jgi:lipid-A-disaccharide synthase
MIGAVKKLIQEYPHLTVKVSRCGHMPASLYKKITGDLAVEFVDGPLEELFQKSDLAIVTSGTATLQAALMGIPMVIVYKISAITFALFKMMVSEIKYAGLPNILADKEVAPEYLQKDMKSQSITEAIKNYIEYPEEYMKTRDALAGIKESFGSIKPSLELTEIIKNCSGITGDTG